MFSFLNLILKRKQTFYLTLINVFLIKKDLIKIDRIVSYVTEV